MNLLHRISRGGARVSGTVVLLAAVVVAVLGCYLLVLGRASAQPEQQYDQDGRITLCHWEPAQGGRYVEITVASEAVAAAHRRNHPNDIIPAPAGGCPGPPIEPTPTPEPTTPEPGITICHFNVEASQFVEITVSNDVADAHERNHPNDLVPAPEGGCPTGPEPTVSPTATATATVSPTATATATVVPSPEPTTVVPSPSPSPEPTTPGPTATATATASPGQPCAEPGGEAEVTGPDGEVTTITLCDLDVGDPLPHPGGPGGISRSEVQGEVAAAEALLAGEDFDGAVDAAQPYLDAEDSRDAARLMAAQLGESLPATGGPAALSIIAAMLLVGSGVFAWRLGVRGRL